jgi:hypothetical protein
MSIADQIEEAIAVAYSGMGQEVDTPIPGKAGEVRAPTSDSGLLVRFVKLRNNSYPGRDAHGILPVFVVGHQAMSEDAWRQWVRGVGTAAYGPAYAERMAKEGIDLKEMTPTAAFGRSMRLSEGRRSTFGRRYLDQAVYLLNVVEKWPSLYNIIANEMAGATMTLSTFMDRISTLPSPHEIGEGQHSTLGDLIGRGMMLLPDY